jgi:hypothetical protein
MGVDTRNCGGRSQRMEKFVAILLLVCTTIIWMNGPSAEPLNATPTACSDGGACEIGDVGPGGGTVFYVEQSGSFQCGPTLNLTCQYLEVAPTSGVTA